jgi:uncharacterized protein YndB with AHSA1/START domain
VYDDWLDPEALAELVCPRPAIATRIECDPVVGGAYRLDIEEGDGQRMTVTGRYLELRRPHRLSFTWYCTTWEPGTPESVVTVTFDPHGAGDTMMTIEHATWPDHVGRHRAAGARHRRRKRRALALRGA